MKILLVPGNTDLNRGDQALVWESINVIKEVYENPDVILMKGDDYRQYAQTERLGYNMIHGILKHPGRFFSNKKHISYTILDKVKMGCVALYDLMVTASLLIPCRIINNATLGLMSNEDKRTYETFRSCDAVFVKGGGFIHSYGMITDAYQIYYLLYYILLSIRFKKKIVILPNSIGPLRNKIAAKLSYYVLNHCQYISVRESVSENFLNKSEQIRKPVYRHADLGYFLKSSKFDALKYLKNKGIEIDKPKVVITLRPYRFPGEENAEQLYKKYIVSFAEYSEYLYEKGYQIVFSAHTLGPSVHENDSIAIDEVVKILGKTKVPFVVIDDESLDCKDVMALYSQFDILVGTRFHSVIFAQNSFVPTIAITYGGNKGVGIMQDTGLEEYSIPMENVTSAALMRITDTLITNKKYVAGLMKNKRCELENDRQKLIDEIKMAVLN